MLSLDQVRLLENRVEKAVGKIQQLESENERLRGQIDSFQGRIGELEGLVRAFKDDQGRIEEGILNALDRLSAFEDSVFAENESIDAAVENSIEIGNAADPILEVMEQDETPSSASDGQMDIF